MIVCNLKKLGFNPEWKVKGLGILVNAGIWTAEIASFYIATIPN